MTPSSPTVRWIGLAVWLSVTYAAAALGAIASADAPAFYGQLAKPSWAPPPGWFGPVWTVLYTLMGIAAWLVWQAPGDTRRALVLYVVQLVANALWSWLFFAWHRGALASVEILVLLALIAATAWAFRRHHRVAALLLVPYLAWVAFAAMLTWRLWRTNPGLL